MEKRRERRNLRLREPSMHPNSSKILILFAEVQDRVHHHDKVKNALSQIARHTRDPRILKTCRAIAEVLEIEFEEKFEQVNDGWYFDAVRKLQNHSAWVMEKYQVLQKEIGNYDPKWTEALSKLTDTQIARLSQLVPLLDVEPDICDKEGNIVRPNDLVVYPCQDEQGRTYEHYGVIRATPKGYRIAHFFTGETIKLENRVAEVGLGYVHFTPYSSDWFFKERPDSVVDAELESRISNSQNDILGGNEKLWNKLTYNCEHWTREMVYGVASSTQVDNLRKRNEAD